MATTIIGMTKSSLDSLASKSGKFSTNIDALATRVDKVSKSLDMEVKAKAGIETSLAKNKTNMKKEKEFYTGVQKAIIRTKEDMFGEDSSLKSKILGAFGMIASIIGGGTVFPIIHKTEISEPTSSAQIERNTAPKTDQESLAEINERYQNLLKAKKRTTYQGWCGQLAADQLNAKGIPVPAANGKDLCNTILNSPSNGKKYTTTSYSSFDELVKASESGPVSNVVLSFNKGGYFTNNAGHGMVIDRIENGKVYFIDNTSISDTAPTGKNNGQYVAQCMSVTDFKKWYFASGNKSAGIVQVQAK